MELNITGLAGIAAAAPEPYRNIYGHSNVKGLWLDLTRDSGAVDRVLVLYKEDHTEIRAQEIAEGSRLEVTGTIQTYKDTQTGRTPLFVWAQYIAEIPEGTQQLNVVHITGELAREPVYRETPKGREITDLMVRVPSIFAEGFYSYIPCIAWGRLAREAAAMPEGYPVHLEGRLQSREYTKDQEVRTTWEVSIFKLDYEGE